jgi:hypothetical protein
LVVVGRVKGKVVVDSLDSLIAQRNAFTGNWVVPNLPADEYRIHFSLTGQSIQIDEWIQVNEGSGITASFTASATEVKFLVAVHNPSSLPMKLANIAVPHGNLAV